MTLDQGLRGKKVAYTSLPMKYAVGFEVETAGYLDPEAEVEFARSSRAFWSKREI